MKVTCNRIGGFDIHGIVLRHGDNEVDEERWNEAVKRLPNGWLKDLTTPDMPGAEPQIVVHANGATRSKTAKEKIAEVKAAESYAELDALEDGEKRQTVLTAIYERAAEIDAREKPE